jgi:hypothetical protein
LSLHLGRDHSIRFNRSWLRRPFIGYLGVHFFFDGCRLGPIFSRRSGFCLPSRGGSLPSSRIFGDGGLLRGSRKTQGEKAGKYSAGHRPATDQPAGVRKL